ncbi:MAG TPA: tail fiber protein [Candidatus Elarobacter sp.]|jgi:microcystin-dependent protein|nr:tail fiber protein [Candidatus Elarobacter sp.]
MFGGSFAPAGWMTCDGQTLPISEYDTLFNLIGTTYGGDGQSTFNLPNITGRVPVHMGTNPSTGTTYTLGQLGGVSSVTLTTAQIPNHTHPVAADSANASTNQTVPTNTYYGNPTPTNIYSPGNAGPLHPMMTLQSQGGSQPHDNLQPYLAVTYIISLFGIYPSPT